MQDDPPENEPDEFDGMLDDAPSTTPIFRKTMAYPHLDNETTTPDKASG